MTFVCYGCRLREAKKTPAPMQKKFQQLQLGASENGQLKLCNPVVAKTLGDQTVNSVEPWAPNGEAIIFRLPDELISEICKLASAAVPEWPRIYGDYGRVLALTKVCKRFNRVAQPLLYHTIRFANPCSLVPPCIPAKRFYRTMKANPSLGRFCKNLKLYVSDIPSVESISDYKIANEILCWLPNVTSLDLQGGFNGDNGPALWALIQKVVKHMPLIKDVALHREDIPGLLMVPIIENLKLPHLRKLEIGGISGVTTDRNENRQEHYGAKPKNGYERTASFTTLVISDFMEEPSALAHLLAWPKNLEHFTFHRINWNRVHWDLATFESLLAPYSSSLKSISIGTLSSGKTTINLSYFTELSTLSLSHWQLHCTPEFASATLLAPKLHTFISDFGVYDQHSENWSDFGQEQADWILRFAELAAAKKSALKTIHLIFAPDEWSAPSTHEQYKVVGYPWDRMDDLSIAMRSLGIELEHSPKPFYTKYEVEKRIEENEERLKWPDGVCAAQTEE